MFYNTTITYYFFLNVTALLDDHHGELSASGRMYKRTACVIARKVPLLAARYGGMCTCICAHILNMIWT